MDDPSNSNHFKQEKGVIMIIIVSHPADNDDKPAEFGTPKRGAALTPCLRTSWRISLDGPDTGWVENGW